MGYRIVQWATGNVGRHTLAGIDAHPELELVGLFVSNPDKVGRDAGELAGLGRTLGVAGTSDVDALLAIEARLHRAHRHGRRPAGRGRGRSGALPGRRHQRGVLRPGVPPVPRGGRPHGRAADRGGHRAGVSLFVNGVDPGFANDALPLVLSGICERIEEVRCSEVLNYNTYNQPMVLFDIMGFGRDLHDVPMLLLPGVLTMAWGSVVRQIAAGLGVTLTDVTEWYDARRRPRTSRSPPAPSRRAPPPRCTSRCAAWWATGRSSCSST